MKPSRKAARDFLRNCNREEYDRIIERAKLTPRQKAIIRYLIIEDQTVPFVACDLNISWSTIERHASMAYDKIYRELVQNSGTYYSSDCCSIAVREQP